MPACGTCGEKFWTWGGLEKHQSQVHSFDSYSGGDHSHTEPEVNVEKPSEPDWMAEDRHGYNSFNRPRVDYTRLSTSRDVQIYVRQLRSKGWEDHEIRVAFEDSVIDIDRYL